MKKNAPKNLTEELYKMRKLMSYDSKRDIDNMTSHSRLIEETLLREQSESDGFAFLGKVDPDAVTLLKERPTKPEVRVSDSYVLSYVPSEQKDTGTLYIFKVGVDRGIPYIYQMYTVLFRALTSSGKLVLPNNDIIKPGSIKLSSYGKTTVEILNAVWDDLNEQKTQEVINGGLIFIEKNLETFKKEFQKITRSEWALKNWWGDNPQSFNRSQYGMWVEKLNDNAKKVVDKVNDDDLMGNIEFKTKNWRNDGKYTELKIPNPVS